MDIADSLLQRTQSDYQSQTRNGFMNLIIHSTVLFHTAIIITVIFMATYNSVIIAITY